MITVTAIKQNSSTFTLFDANCVKSTLKRFHIDFVDFSLSLVNCKFKIDEQLTMTENFYKTCVVLDSIYNIRLTHPRILTIESMMSRLAKLLDE